MYISSKQIAGSKVFDSDGLPVGRLARVVLDPDNGQILAFELIQHGPKYLSPQDIVAWKKNYLTLGQHFEIYSADDLIRLQKVLRTKHVDLKGRKVRTKSGVYLGRVVDYTLHTDHYVLASITVQKNFFGLWSYDTRLIHQCSILHIKPREIIVRDSYLKLPVQQSSPDEFDLQNSPTFDQA